MGGEEVIPEETQGLSLPAGQQERIFVSVRLRPLNEKEYARNDVSDWECINGNTIIFKNSLLERSAYPPAYTFDRVFGYDCNTKQVYEGGAKEVSLSVVTGINSTIFAYGQTSSGKTYTMRGVTEYAMQDIYGYIDMHQEREFVLKFSAMEIYNEAVKDLLSTDSTPLRLLDDPEKGTVVERLTEEIVRDMSHLKELLAACEDQRQIGETALNETSSRSHQILRLTIDSSAREYLGAGNSSILSASVNFVDLAGSERASQTLNAGARLKEGSHINRSLLTLGTVIRKLSKGRNAHIPYRDSKLTRILQNSLGGNARTSIICTISPARSHVEQSRNTLLFASCAKEVATNAQVNVVMSDKALVKQLQKELARLESEMKSLQSTSKEYDVTLLKEKEQVIEKMDREIRKLILERDLAQSRVENLLQSFGEEDQGSRLDAHSEAAASDISYPVHSDVGLGTYNTPKNVDNSLLDNSTPKIFNFSENHEHNFLLDNSTPKFVGLDPFRGWGDISRKTDEYSEDTCKEVRCIEMEATGLNRKTDSDVLPSGLKEKEGKSSMTKAKPEAAVSPPCQEVRSFEVEESSIDRKTESDVFSPGTEEKERKSSLTEAVDEDAELYPQGDRCINMEESSSKKTTEADVLLSGPEEGKLSTTGDISEVPVTSNPVDKHDTEALKQKIQELQKTISYLVNLYPVEQSPPPPPPWDVSSLKLSRSASCKAALVPMQSSLALEKVEKYENTPATWSDNNILARPGGYHGKLSDMKHSPKVRDFDSQTSVSAASMETQSIKEYDADDASSIYEQNYNTSLWFEKAAHTPTNMSEKSFPATAARKFSEFNYSGEIGHFHNKYSETSVSTLSAESRSIKETDSEDSGIHEFVSKQNEKTELPSPKKFGDYLVQEMATDSEESVMNAEDAGVDTIQPLFNWPAEFERQRNEIIELWDACNVLLVHRTYFFLLFKGDPSDSVYMAVELRRLSFLKGGNITKESFNSRNSLKSLCRERETLSKQIHHKYSRKEREELYTKWGIALNTKQRSLQLARRIWSSTKDMNHVKESAALVAKLIDFVQPGQAPKEIFGLSFSHESGSKRRRSYSLRPSRRSSLSIL